MKRQVWLYGGLVAVCAIAGVLMACNSKPPQPAKVAVLCPQFPTAMAGSNEETMWQIFVAANCPAGNGLLTWETWTEQYCFQNPQECAATPVGRHLHGSSLARAKAKAVPNGPPITSNGICSQMTGTAAEPAGPLQPWVPTNLNPVGAQFCEEVFVNPAETGFVNDNNLTTLANQAKYGSQTPIKFPSSSVEIKADWLPKDALDSTQPPFTCTKSADKLYVEGPYTEKINGTCYALVGLHISSKILPNWLWGTFEPQYPITNPNRCDSTLYSGCNDPFGSDPPVAIKNGPGTPNPTTKPTAALTGLLASIDKRFLNYRLTGAQADFNNVAGNPIRLSNSFTELNAQVLPGQGSCITCHSYAMLSNPALQSAGGGPLGPPIGPPVSPLPPPPAGGTWVNEDFSWMLSLGLTPPPPTPPTPPHSTPKKP